MACCSPTSDGEVPVSHEYLKRYQFELVDEHHCDAEDFEIDTSAATDEAAVLEDDAKFGQNEADIQSYNMREMKSPGNNIVVRRVKAEYRQGSRFLTQWVQYPVFEATWEQVKVFVHADGRLNKAFVEFCYGGRRKYFTDLRAARRPSQKYKKTGERSRKQLCNTTGAKGFF